MNKIITELGPREAEFLSKIASENKPEHILRNAIAYWGSKQMAWKKLRLLEKKGWIARIERGKYIIIPLEAGPERVWTEDPYLIAQFLVQPGIISYWTAIRHWNWTEQIPQVVYVQTTRRKSSSSKTIFGVRYEIVTVNKKKFYGYTTEWREGKKILVTDREKTLVDCADYPERAGLIEEIVKAVSNAASEISWKKLGEYVNRFPNGAVKKRLGYLFETYIHNLPQEADILLKEWRLNLSKGMSLLIPSGGERGSYSRRWGLFVNAET